MVPPQLGLVAGGFLLGILLAAPPGPVMMIMAGEAARGRPGRAMRTAFGAMTGDATWLALAAIGFLVFLQERPVVVGVLALLGAALLLWMAWGAWRAARAGIEESATRGTYRLGYLTVLTSPFSFAFWLANGALLLSTWGAWGIVGLFAGLVAYTVAFSFGVAWLGRRVERMAVWVAYASAVALAGFAGWVGWGAWGYLRG